MPKSPFVSDLKKLVRGRLSEVSDKYGFAQEQYERRIHAQPIVLVIGNYSAGKSTFINAFAGTEVQTTAQGPEDDCFTVITRSTTGQESIRDGSSILQDPAYPFDILSRHGSNFRSHLKGKQIISERLEGLVIVDTPGMLDSATDTERGYDYQAVLGDFARIADLIVVMFDTHKAGTVYESYVSLRQTLPGATFEDRVVFVLNRIDECATVHDLLKVYGTLCWNLSQMTRRKDIPKIYLSHMRSENSHLMSVLPQEINQRQELFLEIENLKRARWYKVLSFLEDSSEGLSKYLSALETHWRKCRTVLIRLALVGLFLSIGAALSTAYSFGLSWQFGIGCFASLYCLYLLLLWKPGGYLVNRLLLRRVKVQTSLNDLDVVSTESLQTFLRSAGKGRVSLWTLRRDLKKLHEFRLRLAEDYRRKQQEQLFGEDSAQAA